MPAENESVLPDPPAPAACSASGCTCSVATGTCSRCRRTHRIAYGTVAALAAITAAVWAYVSFLPTN